MNLKIKKIIKVCFVFKLYKQDMVFLQINLCSFCIKYDHMELKQILIIHQYIQDKVYFLNLFNYFSFKFILFILIIIFNLSNSLISFLVYLITIELKYHRI